MMVTGGLNVNRCTIRYLRSLKRLFKYIPIKRKATTRLNRDFAKLDQAYLESPRRELFNGGLENVVALTVCCELFFRVFILEEQSSSRLSDWCHVICNDQQEDNSVLLLDAIPRWPNALQC